MQDMVCKQTLLTHWIISAKRNRVCLHTISCIRKYSHQPHLAFLEKEGGWGRGGNVPLRAATCRFEITSRLERLGENTPQRNQKGLFAGLILHKKVFPSTPTLLFLKRKGVWGRGGNVPLRNNEPLGAARNWRSRVWGKGLFTGKEVFLSPKSSTPFAFFKKK